MKLKWETRQDLYGENMHEAFPYTVAKRAPYAKKYQAWVYVSPSKGELLGEGSWQKCRAICQKHHEERSNARN